MYTEGSGSGEIEENRVPFTCASDSMDTLQLEVFDILTTKLSQLFGCAPTESTETLLYTITPSIGDPIQTADAANTVDDYFNVGSHSIISIKVCVLSRSENESLSCDEVQPQMQIYNGVTIVVNPNTQRLFPYGPGDVRVSDIDDSTFDVVLSNGIPFLNGTYNTIHVSC